MRSIGVLVAMVACFAVVVESALAPLRAWGSLPQGRASCAFCELVVKAAEVAANSTTVAQVVAALNRTCDELFHHNDSALRLCQDLAVEAGHALAKLPDIVTLSDDYPAKVVCAMLFRDVCHLPCCSDPVRPEQVYITFGAQNSEVRATWVTLHATASVVQWGAGSALQWEDGGTIDTYTAGGWVGTIHHASMVGLRTGVSYSYRVGDGVNWSPVAAFVNPVDSYPVQVAIVADMGAGNTSRGTMQRVQQLITKGAAQWILHVGDVAYADGNQIIWDQYGRQVEPLVRTAPYMLLPGNHEIAFNFSAFKHRYPMAASPAPGDAMYWSFDRAGVRFVAVDGESEIDTPLVTNGELAWLDTVLSDGATRKQRGQLQWLVVSIHRPLYCSSDVLECQQNALYLRAKLERLFQKHMVDLVLQAHKHNYERTTPVFAGLVMAPRTAPTYVLNGIAGSREGNSDFNPNISRPPWRVVAFTSKPGSSTDLWGYAMLNVTPDRLTWTMYSDDERTPIDTFSLQPRGQ